MPCVVITAVMGIALRQLFILLAQADVNSLKYGGIWKKGERKANPMKRGDRDIGILFHFLHCKIAMLFLPNDTRRF